MKGLFVLLIWFPICLKAQATYNDLGDFLRRTSVQIDANEIIENTRQFLDSQEKKGSITWYDGRLLTTDNKRFEDLKLKINVFNNSVYTIYNKEVYKIPNSRIETFAILRNGKWSLFKKRYGVPFEASIKAKSSMSIQELMKYLIAYPVYIDLQPKEILLSKDDVTELSLKFEAGFKNEVFALKRYLSENEEISSVVSEYIDSEVGQNIYMEVLYQNQYFEVLKYNFKKSIKTESVGIVNSSSQFMTDDEDYYFANSNKLLTPFLFGRNSVSKALNSLGVKPEKNVKGVGSERKLVAWCNSNKFSIITSD